VLLLEIVVEGAGRRVQDPLNVSLDLRVVDGGQAQRSVPGDRDQLVALRLRLAGFVQAIAQPASQTSQRHHDDGAKNDRGP